MTSADGPTSQSVVIVNETLARRLTPGRSPVGRTVKFEVPAFNGQDGTRVWSAVGVATDTWDRGPRASVEPEVLIPLTQTPPRSSSGSAASCNWPCARAERRRRSARPSGGSSLLLTREDDACLVVLDRDGVVRWLEHGGFDASRSAELKTLLAGLVRTADR